jgi:activator of HSP90 ATPase
LVAGGGNIFLFCLNLETPVVIIIPKNKTMSKTIVQKIVFKNTTPGVLYDLYMNAKKHAMVTGAPATITAKEGSKYTAHGSYITGKNLRLVKDRLIVQTWRGADWEKDDPDSTFIIELSPKGKDVILHAIHANLPDKHAGSIDKGWHDHYWNPWKMHLAGKPIKIPSM